MNWKLLIPVAIFCTGIIATATAPAQDAFFNSNGVKIRYVTAGEGEAIVLVHGWMGDATMWGNPKPTPLPGFKVIALDCRGHGKSDKLYDPKQYGPEMAKDVIRLLDHLKIKRAHLIGYSMGSFIIGQVAATNPDRVISLIYGGQAPLVKGTHPQAFSEADAFAKAVKEGKGLGPYIIAVSPANRPKPTTEQAKAYANFMFAGKDVKALAASGLNFRGMEISLAALIKCKAPSLFIYGGNESDYVMNRVAAVRKLLPGTEEKIIEGGDHMTTVAKPGFGQAIVDFIMKNKGK